MALVSCLLFGLGVGVGVLGVVIWQAGRVSAGVDAGSLRWTALPLLITMLGGLIWSATLSAYSFTAQRVGNATGWVLAIGCLIAAGLALRSPAAPRVDDRDYDDVVTNAALFDPWAPVALLTAAVLLGVAAGVGRRAMDDDLPQLAVGWRSWSVVALAGCMVTGCGLATPRIADARATTANLQHQVETSGAAVGLDSRLTGETAWTSVRDDIYREFRLSTVGGLALSRVEPTGVEMLDPATGRVRWSWRRTDLHSGLDAMVASADGNLIAARVSPLDVHPAAPMTVVLDARTGAVRAEFSDNVGTPLTVSEDRLVTISGDLTAYDFGGDVRWTSKLDTSEIKVSDPVFVSAGTDTLLLTEDSEQPGWRTIAVELADGSVSWRRDLPPQSQPLAIVPGTDLAVTGGLRQESTGGSGVESARAPTADALAVRVTDGEPVWERELPVAKASTGESENDGCVTQLNVDADHLTFLSCAGYGRTVELTSLAPATGERFWSRTISTTEAAEQAGDEIRFNATTNPLLARSDGSTAFLMGTRQGCAIVRADHTGVDRIPIIAGVRGSCDYTSWFGVSATAVLAQPTEGLLIALR